MTEKISKLWENITSYDVVGKKFDAFGGSVAEKIASTVHIAVMIWKAEREIDGGDPYFKSSWNFDNKKTFRDALVNIVSEKSGKKLGLSAPLNLVSPLKHWVDDQGMDLGEFMDNAEFYRIGCKTHKDLISEGKVDEASTYRQELEQSKNQKAAKELTKKTRADNKLSEGRGSDGTSPQHEINCSTIEAGLFDGRLDELAVQFAEMIQSIDDRKAAIIDEDEEAVRAERDANTQLENAILAAAAD